MDPAPKNVTHEMKGYIFCAIMSITWERAKGMLFPDFASHVCVTKQKMSIAWTWYFDTAVGTEQ